MILHETIIYMGPQVEQELLTLPEHLRSILWIIVFLFVLFAIGHCVVCPFRWMWHLIIDVFCIYRLFLYLIQGLSWSWSYGSWIYNHLCNQCLLSLKLWVRTLFMARCIHSALSKLNTEPSIGASHQMSLHLAKQFQRRFLEIDQPEKRIACGGQVC